MYLKRTVATALLLCLCTASLSAQARRGTFIPNFRDIEIQDFLKTMAQVTRRNILVDDSVKGKITVVAYKPIPVSEAVTFLKQVLEVRGFAVIEEGNLIKVVAQDRAVAQSDIIDETPSGRSADQISRVLKLPAYIDAAELATLLKTLGGKSASVDLFRSGNAVVISGYAPAVRRLLKIAEEVKPKTGPDGTLPGQNESVHIYRVKNLQAETLAQVLSRLDNPQVPVSDGEGKEGEAKTAATTKAAGVGAANQKIKAVAHKESNSIIVTANAEEWKEIRSIIMQLDSVRKQILLEVLIAEVSGSDINDFGIDWRYAGADAAYSQFNSGLAAEGNLVDPETGRITGNNTLSGFSLGFLERGGQLLGIFNANVSNQNFNVLSAPQILTLDNQEAEINVGQDVPVQTQARTTGGGNAEATVNSFEYRPAGIKLKFTPNINTDGNIALDLFAEVTNIEGGQTANSNPTFSKRNVKTYITVEDKQTIVIGGLVSNEQLNAVQKIPLLGDIPFLGFIFRRTTITNKRTNLMVFITPHILDEREESDRVTGLKRNQQVETSREAVNKLKLWPQDESPEERETEKENRIDEHPVKQDPPVYKKPEDKED